MLGSALPVQKGRSEVFREYHGRFGTPEKRRGVTVRFDFDFVSFSKTYHPFESLFPLLLVAWQYTMQGSIQEIKIIRLKPQPILSTSVLEAHTIREGGMLVEARYQDLPQETHQLSWRAGYEGRSTPSRLQQLLRWGHGTAFRLETHIQAGNIGNANQLRPGQTPFVEIKQDREVCKVLAQIGNLIPEQVVPAGEGELMIYYHRLRPEEREALVMSTLNPRAHVKLD